MPMNQRPLFNAQPAVRFGRRRRTTCGSEGQARLTARKGMSLAAAGE